MATNVDFKWRGNVFNRNVNTTIKRCIDKAALMVDGATKDKLSISGEFYGQPSKPGEPPHKQTGHLRESIGPEFAPDGMTAKVGPRDLMAYGRVHEFGDKDEGGNLPARPFLGPAFDECAPKIQAKILADLKKAGVR